MRFGVKIHSHMRSRVICSVDFNLSRDSSCRVQRITISWHDIYMLDLERLNCWRRPNTRVFSLKNILIIIVVLSARSNIQYPSDSVDICLEKLRIEH